jgi:hypothetical protein
MRRFALCLIALLAMSRPAHAAAASDMPLTYAAIRPQLRTSAVPVLLPMPPPPAIRPLRSIAVISAGPGGYYVGFSSVVRCAGALSCAFFHVSGYPATRRPGRVGGRDRALRLPDGTRGFYTPGDCSGASCTEASLTFERRGTVYELDAKVAEDSLEVLERAYRTLRILR